MEDGPRRQKKERAVDEVTACGEAAEFFAMGSSLGHGDSKKTRSDADDPHDAVGGLL